MWCARSVGVLVVLAGCNFPHPDLATDGHAAGSDAAAHDARPDATPDAPPAGQRIQDVQSVDTPVGTPFALSGVVISAIDMFGNKTGDVWIEEAGGGELSGVHIFGASAADVSVLAVGDVIDVAGAVKTEFALVSDTSGRTVTELEPASAGTMTLTKTGHAPVPPATVVDALAIGQLAEPMRSAAWAKWEGVLITVKNVTQVAATKTLGGGDPTFVGFPITGGTTSIETSLAPVPGSGLGAGACLASVTGVLDYLFTYNLLPRATSEIVTGGTACPPAEQTAATCADTIDNDGNGFVDCDDPACKAAVAACN